MKKQILALFLVLGLTTVVKAQDKVVKPFASKPAPKFKPEISYDFVKDTTTVTGSEIVFHTAETRKSDDGEDLSDKILLNFLYSYKGKASKIPDYVTLNLFELRMGRVYKMDKIYLRYGSKTLTLPVKNTMSEDQYVGNNSVQARLKPSDFMGIGKSSDLYIKIDSREQTYAIDKTFMPYIAEVAKTIPQKANITQNRKPIKKK